MQEHNKASAWFDELYKKHQNNHQNIPWARLDVNPFLESYLGEQSKHRGKALVIGCGLGDDAHAIAQAGYDVVAIDVSQTALGEAQKRFPDSGIVFEKQDIFDMPQKYYEAFDFVFESLTVQSLPREFREKMIQAVVNTVKKDGKLLVIAHQYNGNNDGPPWPLKDEEIFHFERFGMKKISLELVEEGSAISNIKYKALYIKE